MRRFAALIAVAAALFVAGFYCVAQAQWSTPIGRAVIFNKRPAPSVGCSQATTFLARTSLTGGDVTNYTNLICGLVTDGLIDGTLAGAAGCGTYFNTIYFFATADTTTALLNLCGTSYTATANGSPSFTAYRGYTGVDASTTVYIDTGFIPSGIFSQDSAHVSAWSNTSTASTGGGGFIIGDRTATAGVLGVVPRYVDDNAYFRINEGGSLSGGTTNTNGTGHYLGNRANSSGSIGYKNGASFATLTSTSAAPVVESIYILAARPSGAAGLGFGGQVAMASIGGSLSGAQVTNFYNRLRTYMTAVGVP